MSFISDLIIKILDVFTSPFYFLYKGKLVHYEYKKSVKSILISLDDKSLFGWYKPSNLIESREFRGMINSLLQPGDYHYSAKDIAVAINITTAHFCKNELNKDSHEIIDMAYHIVSELKEVAIKNKIIRDGLTEYGKNIRHIDADSDRSEIEGLFMDKKSLFKYYFSTFNDSRYHHTIKVWHQGNDNTWIDWTENNSINVSVNPYKIREGFFLVGFDYCDITNDENLHVASNENGYEIFNKYIDQNSCVWMQ